MKRISLRRVGAALALISVTALGACAGPSGQSGEGGADGTINVFMYQKPIGVFGPLAPASGPDQQVLSLIFEPLMVGGPDGTLVPQLAESEPELSADGKTVTFTLKDDLKWSDGKPITAEDVVFTFTRGADAATLSGYAANFASIAGLEEYVAGKAETISGLKAVDDRTVTITTTKPDVGIVGRVATIGILPSHALADQPVKEFATNDWFRKPEVTSGPFTFVEYKTDQYVHLKKNPEFREEVGADDVYLKPLTADVATSQLSTGEMDIASISPNDIEAVKQSGTSEIQEAKSFGFVRAAWNQTQKRFQDPRVRQAFLYAIDREGLLDSALDGKGTVRSSVLDPLWSGEDIEDYPYDPEKAKDLLEEAGWDSDEPVKLSWIAGSNPDRDAAATVLEDQLNKVGIKLELNQVQASFFESAYKNKTFDMVLYGGGDYATEPSNAGSVTNCDLWVPGGPNIGYYCDKGVDKLFAAANAEVDPEKRAELYKQAAQAENENPSMMWLYSGDTVYGVSERVDGFVASNITTFFEAWKWKTT